jgi:hypothetical protein
MFLSCGRRKVTSVIWSSNCGADIFKCKAHHKIMTSKISTWMIVAGTGVALIGLCFFPAALGGSGDRSLLGIGTSVFAFGTLIISAGIYLKTNALRSLPKGKEKTETQERPVRGACDRCKSATPAIQCKVHQTHLCPSCLAEHYDFRSCVYVPSTRRNANAKSVAARAR